MNKKDIEESGRKNNHIFTKEYPKIGNIYDYKEDSFTARVELLSIEDNDERIALKLKILDSNYKMKPVFEVWAAHGSGFYNRMWYLHDEGTYSWGRPLSPAEMTDD